MMFRKLAALIAAGFMLASCGGGGDGADQNAASSAVMAPVTVVATVKGVIVDQQDQPVAGATIVTDGKTTSSASDGSYETPVSVIDGRAVLLIKKDGYATTAKEVPVVSEGTTILDAKLRPDDVQVQIDAAAGGTVVVSGKASVKIEPNSIRTADGTSYAGNVTVNASYYSPDTVDGAQSFPQPYAGMDNGQKAVLRSVGVLEVKLTDNQGNPLQLDAAQPATLIFPASSVAEGVAVVPLWYYDEEARIWVREGEALLQGDGTYLATVKHFTLWNADKPYLVAEGTLLKGCAKDANGQPVAAMYASVKGNGVILWGTTGEDGTFETYVPSGVTLYVRYYSAVETSPYEVEVSPLQAGEVRQLECQVVAANTDPTAAFIFPQSLYNDLIASTTPTAPTTPTTPTAQSYAGVYSGTYSGAETGTFSVTVADSGVVSGSGVSTTYGLNFSVSGSISGTGAISMSAVGSAGSSSFSGTVDQATGKVTGTWNYAGSLTGGTFDGQKN